jgi:uncharacterized repeat protein (TIGR03803 family)
MREVRLVLRCSIGKFLRIGLFGLLVITSQIGQSQTLKPLYAFTDGADGYSPFDTLILQNGSLYGVDHNAAGGLVFQLTETGIETTLYSFTGEADGDGPLGPLVQDANGNLYGTTWQGGAYGYGTVFKIDPADNETVLYSFHDELDGGNPYGGLAMDRKGNLYGTTWHGGESNYGTVFEVTPAGTETVLYAFTGGADGGLPTGALLRDAKGNLYGTTASGGSSYWGTVFELVRSKKTYSEQVLYNFTGGSDGGYPNGELIADKKGNLYGTTPAYAQIHSNGTVFKLTPTGTLQVLHTFGGLHDGQNPSAGLVRDKHGNLYGTTSYGGTGTCVNHSNQGCGTVFSVSPTGKENVLYNFSGKTDGAFPFGGLVADATGNLYGTTIEGGLSCAPWGSSGCGVVFELTP